MCSLQACAPASLQRYPKPCTEIAYIINGLALSFSIETKKVTQYFKYVSMINRIVESLKNLIDVLWYWQSAWTFLAASKEHIYNSPRNIIILPDSPISTFCLTNHAQKNWIRDLGGTKELSTVPPEPRLQFFSAWPVNQNIESWLFHNSSLIKFYQIQRKCSFS